MRVFSDWYISPAKKKSIEAVTPWVKDSRTATSLEWEAEIRIMVSKKFMWPTELYAMITLISLCRDAISMPMALNSNVVIGRASLRCNLKKEIKRTNP